MCIYLKLLHLRLWDQSCTCSGTEYIRTRNTKEQWQQWHGCQCAQWTFHRPWCRIAIYVYLHCRAPWNLLWLKLCSHLKILFRKHQEKSYFCQIWLGLLSNNIQKSDHWLKKSREKQMIPLFSIRVYSKLSLYM